LGIAGSAAAAKVMAVLLYETGPKDPVIALGAVGRLLITGLAAAFVPARRAASIDPMRALRAE